MTKSNAIVLHDHLGRRLRGKLLDNGHIQLSQHAHRYTYGRLSRRGLVELYDDSGRFTYAEVAEFEDSEPDLELLAQAA